MLRFLSLPSFFIRWFYTALFFSPLKKSHINTKEFWLTLLYTQFFKKYNLNFIFYLQAIILFLILRFRPASVPPNKRIVKLKIPDIMKVYQTNEIKNISILGSSGSGKTTLAEAMLYEGGVIKRRGSVDGGNTVSDYFPVEKEYGYSVFSTVFSVEWQDRKLNFIDCPGSDDFIGGAVSALNVTDTALMVLNAQYGGSGNNEPVPVYRTIS